MSKFRNVIGFEGVENLPAKVKKEHEDKSQRYLALVEIGERSQEYHHENDAAGSHEAGRKQQNIEEPGYYGGNGGHYQHATRAISSFKNGAKQQYECKVGKEMVYVGVTKNMRKETYIITEGVRVKPSPAGH